MPEKSLTEQKIGQRMVGLALEWGLVDLEQVRECEEFVQENLFQGSVMLALYYRGHIGPEELKKIVDLCLPMNQGEEPELELADRPSGARDRDTKKATRRTILVSKDQIQKMAAEEKARRVAESGGHSPLSSRSVIKYQEVIGPYYVTQMLGRGGMGRVVKAYHRDLGRMVALKFILAERSENQELLRRFEQEAKLAAKLHHPHIVAIYDVDFHAEKPYIAMEYVKGRMLADLISQRQLTVEDSLKLGLKLARALHYAHERDILHRDIKPQNILIDGEGEPRLTDFGLARSIERGSYFHADRQRERVMGTPYYMSPEGIRGDPKLIGRPSDVFSLGAVLFEMLSGELPFDAEEEAQVLKQILYADPMVNLRQKNPAVDADLEAIVLRALEKNPRERYRSAKALAEDLDAYIKGRPIMARPYSSGQRFWRLVGRHRLLVGLLLLLGLLTGGGLLHRQQQARRATSAEDQERALQRERVRALARAMDSARQQHAAGDASWKEMLAAERSGKPAEARRLLAGAITAYDVADHLYATVHQADATRKDVLQQRVELLKKRLRWAVLGQDATEEERLSERLAEIGKLTGQRTLVADTGTLGLTSVPPRIAYQIYGLERRKGRLVKARLPIKHGTTPVAKLALPSGRYLVVLSDSEWGLLREAVLVRSGKHVGLSLRMQDPAAVPERMVYVPGGMTITGGEMDAVNPRPRRTVAVKPFLIARREVTVREYLQFLNALPSAADRMRRAPRRALGGEPLWKSDGAGGLMLPAGTDPNRPVTGISWEDAEAYVGWLSGRFGRAYRLPTADEWERAARSGDGRRYPWGGLFGEQSCLTREWPDAAAELRAGRAASDRSPYGVQDLAGSVREWVADWYSRVRGERMVRGGSYLSGRRWARAASLGGMLQRAVAPDVGFRVACTP